VLKTPRKLSALELQKPSMDKLTMNLRMTFSVTSTGKQMVFITGMARLTWLVGLIHWKLPGKSFS
jgi:hypothetical protein